MTAVRGAIAGADFRAPKNPEHPAFPIASICIF
jgi:hypothetical protein